MPELSEFRQGQRVQLAPFTDAWMKGDRYATVVKTGRTLVYVVLDRSGRRVRLLPELLTFV